MTTAHKPTYHPAIGRTNAGGYRYDVARAQFSSRQLPAHLTMKTRTDLADKDTLALKEALRRAEDKNKAAKREERARQGIVDDDEEPGRPAIKSEATHETSTEAEGGTDESPPLLADVDLSKFDDEDDPIHQPNHDEESEESDDDDDDSDEDAELARELDLIRREREAAKQKAAEAEKAEAERAAHAALFSNPLLPIPPAATAAASASSSLLSASTTGSGVKRRWDDDVVFKNQSRGEDVSTTVKKRFINDTIRSDFHRSFLKRYIR